MWSAYDIGHEVSSVSRYVLCFLARILIVSGTEAFREEKLFVWPYRSMVPVKTKVQLVPETLKVGDFVHAA